MDLLIRRFGTRKNSVFKKRTEAERKVSLTDKWNALLDHLGNGDKEAALALMHSERKVSYGRVFEHLMPKMDVFIAEIKIFWLYKFIQAKPDTS